MLVNWKVIIHNNEEFLPEFEESHHVCSFMVHPTFLVLLLKTESRKDPFLAKHTQRTYQVAISDIALPDIVRTDGAFDQYFIGGRPSPFLNNRSQRAKRVLRVRKIAILKKLLLAYILSDVVELIDLIIGSLAQFLLHVLKHPLLFLQLMLVDVLSLLVLHLTRCAALLLVFSQDLIQVYIINRPQALDLLSEELVLG